LLLLNTPEYWPRKNEDLEKKIPKQMQIVSETIQVSPNLGTLSFFPFLKKSKKN